MSFPIDTCDQLLVEAVLETLESMAFAQAEEDAGVIGRLEEPFWARIPVAACGLSAVTLLLGRGLTEQLTELLYVEDEGQPPQSDLVAEMANIITGRLMLACGEEGFELGVPITGRDPPAASDCARHWGFRVDEEHPLVIIIEPD